MLTHSLHYFTARRSNDNGHKACSTRTHGSDASVCPCSLLQAAGVMIPVYSTTVNMTFPWPKGPLRNTSGSVLVGDSLTPRLVRGFLLPYAWRFTITDIHRGSLSLFHPAGLFEVQTMAVSGKNRLLEVLSLNSHRTVTRHVPARHSISSGRVALH